MEEVTSCTARLTHAITTCTIVGVVHVSQHRLLDSIAITTEDGPDACAHKVGDGTKHGTPVGRRHAAHRQHRLAPTRLKQRLPRNRKRTHGRPKHNPATPTTHTTACSARQGKAHTNVSNPLRKQAVKRTLSLDVPYGPKDHGPDNPLSRHDKPTSKTLR